MEDGIDGRDAQLDLWTLLGTTQAVVDATGRSLTRPGKASVNSDAEAPARADAETKGRGSARSALDLGKVPAGGTTGSCPPTKLAKGKARIAPAKWGNRHIVLVPRCRS